MGIFIDICSYFDKKQEPQSSSRNTDLLVVSHNDLHTIDCDELASSLTKGGVSGVGLAHALLRTAVPKNSLQQRIQVHARAALSLLLSLETVRTLRRKRWQERNGRGTHSQPHRLAIFKYNWTTVFSILPKVDRMLPLFSQRRVANTVMWGKSTHGFGTTRKGRGGG